MANSSDKHQSRKSVWRKDGTISESTNSGFSPLLKELGERLQKRRLELGLSQEELCERIDMNRTYLSDIERGIGNVSILLLFKLSKALQIELSGLLRDIEEAVPDDGRPSQRRRVASPTTEKSDNNHNDLP
jgi:XRE family aerobic/anaerobic benzoate catabolism transcriptional regulator